jgi:hypothetical protein
MASRRVRRKIILNEYLRGRAGIIGKLPPLNFPSTAIGKTPYPEIHTSPDRKISLYILLAPKPVLTISKTKDLTPLPLSAEMQPTLGFARVKLQFTSKFSMTMLPLGRQYKGETSVVDFEIRR